MYSNTSLSITGSLSSNIHPAYKLHSQKMGCDTIQLLVKNDNFDSFEDFMSFDNRAWCTLSKINKTTSNDTCFYNYHLIAGSYPGVALKKNRAKPREHDYSYATQVWYYDNRRCNSFDMSVCVSMC